MKILVTLNKEVLKQRRQYEVLTADQDMTGFLLMEYGDTEYRPDNLWDAIIATGLIGDIGLIKKGQEIVGYMYDVNKFSPHEIETMHFEWDKEPIMAQILKLGGKKFSSKGHVFQMSGEGHADKYTEEFGSTYKPAYKPGHSAHADEEQKKAAQKKVG
jgi:hypothetical protein